MPIIKIRGVILFTIKGKYHGRGIEITWKNGTLIGDELFIQMLRFEAKALEGCLVAFPTMGGTTQNHLQDPFSALYLIIELIDEVYESLGDVPNLPDVPPGAIS